MYSGKNILVFCCNRKYFLTVWYFSGNNKKKLHGITANIQDSYTHACAHCKIECEGSENSRITSFSRLMKWIWYGIYLYLVPLECQNLELFVWAFSFRCWRLAEAKKTLQVGKFLTNAKVMITIITIAILKIIAITAIAKRVTAGHSVWYTLADAVSCRCSNENQEVHFRWMNSENNKTASATPPAKTNDMTGKL